MLLFSLASPVGICIGVGLSATGSEIVIGVFTSLAAGTFLYVGANEVVAEEFETHHHRKGKYAMMILGVGLIIGLSFTESHDHSHDGHDHSGGLNSTLH